LRRCGAEGHCSAEMIQLGPLLFRWLILAIGVFLAANIVPGIEFDSMRTLLLVVLLLSFLNALLRPLLVLMALPFIILTLGLGIVVINALMFMAVGHLVDGFRVDGFWPAVGAAIVVGITNLVLGGSKRPPRNPPSPPPPAPP